MCYLRFLYSAICRQLLICCYSSSCSTLETGKADWLGKMMPTIELIREREREKVLRQRFFRAAVAPCTHGVIQLLSMDPGDDPQGLVNQYLVKNLLQLVSCSLAHRYMHICTHMLLK